MYLRHGRKCVICGALFIPTGSRSAYCSDKCKLKGKIIKPYKKKEVTEESRYCVECGRFFTFNSNNPRKYCSKKCSSSSSYRKPAPDFLMSCPWELGRIKNSVEHSM